VSLPADGSKSDRAVGKAASAGSEVACGGYATPSIVEQSAQSLVGEGTMVTVQLEHPVWAHMPVGELLGDTVVVVAVSVTLQPVMVDVEVLHAHVTDELLISVGPQVS
jgi:hypothetical protein